MINDRFEGCKKIDRSFSMKKANKDSIWVLPLVVFMGFIYNILGGDIDYLKFGYLKVIPLGFIGIVMHELIHGLTWSFFTQNGFKSIKFGFNVKTLTPYAHCKEPLKKKNYILGALLPGIITGLIPYVIAVIIKNDLLMVTSIFLFASAVGDWMVVYSIRNEHSEDFLHDHPTRAGCFVYKK